MKEHIAIGFMIPICLAGVVLLGSAASDSCKVFAATIKETPTQPTIQIDIISVRGCDVIQHIQGDKLIAAHNAADQPKSCKIQK